MNNLIAKGLLKELNKAAKYKDGFLIYKISSICASCYPDWDATHRQRVDEVINASRNDSPSLYELLSAHLNDLRDFLNQRSEQ